MKINTSLMRQGADNIRVLAASMVEKAKSGHPGGAMGGADFVNVLYSTFLVTDPDDPLWIARDRFFLDPGHMSTMLYAVLALTGKYTTDELQQFRQWGSVTPGHPELDPKRGVENTSGPLGQGHTMAVGCAIAEAFLEARFGAVVGHYTYAYISDGGVQEEISQGAGRIAGHLGLGRLIMFYDSNDVQLSTLVKDVDQEDTAAKYRAWGWHVQEIDGTDAQAIADAIISAQAELTRPSIIIGKTVMASGAVKADGTSLEGALSTHGQPLTKAGADLAATIRHLGGNPDQPWEIRPEVKAQYTARAEELRRQVQVRRQAFAQWQASNPDKARQLSDYIKGVLPDIDFAAITHRPGVATRQASADVLAELAHKVGNMIVSSADLANSDKTDAFLKVAGALKKGDFSGAFLHAGVSELTMAAIINGIALHGGVIGACGTFFVFSDYMKPAVRIAALMELPVKYIWTHDSFRVGEDGPTHEPVEHEMQIRLMEALRNFAGHPSVLVLRPGDAAETSVCWDMAMHNTHTPTALILSRQDIPDLPTATGDRHMEAEQARHGGYVVMQHTGARVTLVASGSEVTLLCEVSELLKQEGIPSTVVSIPSIGLFNEQTQEYRDSVIAPKMPCFGLSAGLPGVFSLIKGWHGEAYGLERFGASAPYKVLDEKFGFTVQAVAQKVNEML